MIRNVQDLRMLPWQNQARKNSEWHRNFYRQPQFLSTTLFLSTKYLFHQEFCNQNDNDNKSLHEREIRNYKLLDLMNLPQMKWNEQNTTFWISFDRINFYRHFRCNPVGCMIFFDNNIEYIIFDKNHAVKIGNGLVLWKRRTNAAKTHSKSCFPGP